MKSESILLIDIGNTSVCLGVARGMRISNVSRVLTACSTPRTAVSALRGAAGRGGAEGAVISSVVPAVTRMWRDAAERACGAPPLIVSHKLKLGVKIRYPRPAQIGADRLANACGAAAKYGVPVIVVDFGTALTFDVVSADSSYIGGVIAPGVLLMTDYLAEKTALLPRIKPGRWRHPVGKSTIEAMRIGAAVGYAGMVKEILAFLRNTLGKRKVAVCATGGYAGLVLKQLSMPVRHDPTLTLYGMKVIHDLNVGTGGKRLARRLA